jgi:chromosome segregation ATPase
MYRREMSASTFVILIISFASIALADDFKTTDGTEYKNVTVKRVEPDGIVLSSKSGISKVYFAELPNEVQQRFNYDPEKAAAYSEVQNSAQEQLRKQQEEALRQKAEATRKNNEQFTKDQAGIQWTREQRQSAQALQARLQQLQQEEDDLLHRIGEIANLPSYLEGRSGNRYYSYKNPARADLPYLQSHLNDVRHEKDQVRQQLEQAQR